MVRGQRDLCVQHHRRQHQSQVCSGGLTNSLDAYTMAAIWSNIQAVVCLVCCCTPVYKPTLPGPNFWGNLKSKTTLFFVKREPYRPRDSYVSTSTSGAERMEPRGGHREQGWLAHDDGSSLGLVRAGGEGRPSNSSGSHEIEYPPEAITVQRDQCRRDSSWIRSLEIQEHRAGSLVQFGDGAHINQGALARHRCELSNCCDTY